MEAPQPGTEQINYTYIRKRLVDQLLVFETYELADIYESWFPGSKVTFDTKTNKFVIEGPKYFAQ